MKISECMTQDVCFVKPDCNTYDAARIMCENHIGCIPVCDSNNCICGILTDRDILLRTVACDKDCSQTTASDIMSTDLCTCNQDDDITNAESKMANNQIRRLPVCDEENHVIGILTLGDLAQNEIQLGSQQVCNTISDICSCNSSKNNS